MIPELPHAQLDWDDQGRPRSRVFDDVYFSSESGLDETRHVHVPLKRIGSESEVSAAIVFLLSPGAAFISGSTLRIDGAASLGSRAWPLGKARNSESYNGFHRAYLPDVLKGKE